MRLSEKSSRYDGQGIPSVVTTRTYKQQGQQLTATNLNYIKTETQYKPVEGSNFLNRTEITYMDGLGRAVEQVSQQHSDDRIPQDVAVYSEYGFQGVLEKRYEPFKSSKSDGSYVPVPVGQPYAYTEYYKDPLRRVHKESHTAFDYPLVYTYGTNLIEQPYFPNASEESTFPPSRLYSVTIEDGNNEFYRSYSDLLGRTVQSQVYSIGEATDETNKSKTYSVHDLKNRVTKVYPPLNDGENVNLNNIYQYYYDGRDNIIRKKVPDHGAISSVYDDRDLEIASSNTNIPTPYTHVVSEYDDFGNTLQTGYLTVTFNADGSANIVPISEANILNKNRYETQLGKDIGKLKLEFSRLLEGKTIDEGKTLRTAYQYDIFGRIEKTLQNNHLNFLIDDSRSTSYVIDNADNIIQTSYNHVLENGQNLESTEESDIDHAGRVKVKYHKVTVNGIEGPKQEIAAFSFGIKDEVLTKKLGHTKNSNFLQEINYSYLNNGFLTRINDPNNLQGDLFGMQLDYDQDFTGSGALSQFNGAISATHVATMSGVDHKFLYTYDNRKRLESASFKDASSSVNDGHYNSFYKYDNRGNVKTLSRYGQDFNGIFSEIDDLKYDYQVNTNRLSKVTEHLTTGSKESGYYPKSSATYAYDSNGNLTYDIKTGTTIGYNLFNLPFKFTFDDNHAIEYLYTTSGTKVAKLELDTDGSVLNRTDYLGMTEYMDGVFQFVSNEVGRVTLNDAYTPYSGSLSLTTLHNQDKIFKASVIESSASISQDVTVRYFADERITLLPGFKSLDGATFEAAVKPGIEEAFHYEYYLHDHLGNTRISFADRDLDGMVSTYEVLNEFHYYPFGLEMQGDWTSSTAIMKQNYRYNGKELNEDLGLYDYGARWYDPAVARWTAVDPLADIYSSWSPYNYVMGNPIANIDPDGRSVQNIGVNSNGDVVFDDGKDDGNLFVINDGVECVETLEQLEANSTQLFDNHELVGSESDLKDYVMSQWKHSENGFMPMENVISAEVVTGSRGMSVNTREGTEIEGEQVSRSRDDLDNVTLKIKYSKEGMNIGLSNPYNTRNALGHEKQHLRQSTNDLLSGNAWQSRGSSRGARELDAVKVQRNLKSWSSTTPLFKESIKMYERKWK